MKSRLLDLSRSGRVMHFGGQAVRIRPVDEQDIADIHAHRLNRDTLFIAGRPIGQIEDVSYARKEPTDSLPGETSAIITLRQPCATGSPSPWSRLRSWLSSAITR